MFRYAALNTLGKQRVEAMQICQALLGEKDGWKNHPAVKMWEGHGMWLATYGMTMCDEWIKRGYKDTTRPRLKAYMDEFVLRGETKFPGWIDSDLINSHRSNLIRKLPEHYGPMWPDVPDDLPYVWPTAK